MLYMDIYWNLKNDVAFLTVDSLCIRKQYML